MGEVIDFTKKSRVFTDPALALLLLCGLGFMA
jgi:hypothetical protein